MALVKNDLFPNFAVKIILFNFVDEEAAQEESFESKVTSLLSGITFS